MIIRLPVRDHLPLQQGLRQDWSFSIWNTPVVRDHLPLQQGLRLRQHLMQPDEWRVRDHLPLQQGLRLLPTDTFAIVLILYETIFHYNKD